MNFKNRFSWYQSVQQTVSKVVMSSFPRCWDEDVITYSILRELITEQKEVVIESESAEHVKMKVMWDAFKNTKKLKTEQTYGDMGILVRIEFEPGKFIEGVAFCEMKLAKYIKLDKSSCKFDAVKGEQLTRLAENSENHRTVLYDIIPEENGEKSVIYSIPTNHAIGYGEVSRKLYKFSEDWAYTFTNRFLRGYELNYSKKAVSDLKKFAATKGGVDFLIVAHTTISNDAELDLDNVLKDFGGIDMRRVAGRDRGNSLKNDNENSNDR